MEKNSTILFPLKMGKNSTIIFPQKTPKIQIQDQSIKNVQKTVDFETKNDSSKILYFFLEFLKLGSIPMINLPPYQTCCPHP